MSQHNNTNTATFIGRCIDQAMGRIAADLVIRNSHFLDFVTGELVQGDIAICGDRIVGNCESYEGTQDIDGTGLVARPGLIKILNHQALRF